MRKFKFLASSAVLAAAISGIAVLPGTSAAAATPSCTKRELFSTNGSGFAYVPMNSGLTTTRCSLSQGANNKAVTALQEMINDCYVAKGKISGSALSEDGSFGTNTFNALKKVQTKIGAGSDGKYGPETASKIEAKADSGSCDTFPAS
ncbi:putative peptidoglycan binding protein [Actinoplanes lutulentus]|uniref:Putative peptidoglycan binding protein n=2 Tax=Actinoplanes lutulentus TaxID=1287878 RepID=A0A327Z133_9ACTN|nr:putative peptidoglycan binding protein [Actinoplanes lutulentus]